MSVLVDHDVSMSDDMRDALNRLETLCRVRGIEHLTEQGVRDMLRVDLGTEKAAATFTPAFLLPGGLRDSEAPCP